MLVAPLWRVVSSQVEMWWILLIHKCIWCSKSTHIILQKMFWTLLKSRSLSKTDEKLEFSKFSIDSEKSIFLLFESWWNFEFLLRLQISIFLTNWIFWELLSEEHKLRQSFLHLKVPFKSYTICCLITTPSAEVNFHP